MRVFGGKQGPTEGDLLVGVLPGTFGYCTPKMLESMFGCDLKLLGLPNTVFPASTLGCYFRLWKTSSGFARSFVLVQQITQYSCRKKTTIISSTVWGLKVKLALKPPPKKKTYTCFSWRTTWENSTPTIIYHFGFPSDETYPFHIPIWRL